MIDNYKRATGNNASGFIGNRNKTKKAIPLSVVIVIFLFGCIIGNVWGSHSVRTTYKKTLTNIEDKMTELEAYVYLNFKENGLIIIK